MFVFFVFQLFFLIFVVRNSRRKKSAHSAANSYLLPRMTLDLREFKLGVVWIHFLDLIPRWRAQYFDDLNQLVNARVTGEDGLAQK
jgi:hypothetical protein